MLFPDDLDVVSRRARVARAARAAREAARQAKLAQLASPAHGGGHGSDETPAHAAAAAAAARLGALKAVIGALDEAERTPPLRSSLSQGGLSEGRARTAGRADGGLDRRAGAAASAALAHQLALHERQLLGQVRQCELRQLAFAKKNKAELAPRDARRPLQQDEPVCRRARGAAAAARARRLFVSLAVLSRQLRNFNGVLEVVAALNSAAIYRLRRSWETVPQPALDDFRALDKLMRPERSHAALRAAMREDMAAPTVPYLGLYLTDLTFIEDGNPDTVAAADGSGAERLNFAKCQMVAKALGEVAHFQRAVYAAPAQNMVLAFLRSLAPPNDDEIFQMSLAAEPREANRQTSMSGAPPPLPPGLLGDAGDGKGTPRGGGRRRSLSSAVKVVMLSRKASTESPPTPEKSRTSNGWRRRSSPPRLQQSPRVRPSGWRPEHAHEHAHTHTRTRTHAHAHAHTHTHTHTHTRTPRPPSPSPLFFCARRANGGGGGDGRSASTEVEGVPTPAHPSGCSRE